MPNSLMAKFLTGGGLRSMDSSADGDDGRADRAGQAGDQEADADADGAGQQAGQHAADDEFRRVTLVIRTSAGLDWSGRPSQQAAGNE